MDTIIDMFNSGPVMNQAAVFYSQFGKIPSFMRCDGYLSKGVVNYVEGMGFSKLFTSGDLMSNVGDVTYINSDIHCVLQLSPVSESLDSGSDVDSPERKFDELVYTIRISYTPSKDFDEFCAGLRKFHVESPYGNVYLVLSDSHGSLYTRSYSLRKLDIDLGMNYGDDFIEVSEYIVDSLSTRRSGLYLFHGVAGTGKTSYLRYLIGHVNRRFLFMTRSVAEVIDTPQFVGFLADNPGSVLIMEDAEKLLVSREGGFDSPVSTVLNLTDGIIGDSLGINIVATYNTDTSNVDSALKRKGRLVAEHRFDPLSKENTKRLLAKLGVDNYDVDTGMTLADIYNIHEEIPKPLEHESRLLGFGG